MIGLSGALLVAPPAPPRQRSLPRLTPHAADVDVDVDVDVDYDAHLRLFSTSLLPTHVRSGSTANGNVLLSSP